MSQRLLSHLVTCNFLLLTAYDSVVLTVPTRRGSHVLKVQILTRFSCKHQT